MMYPSDGMLYPQQPEPGLLGQAPQPQQQGGLLGLSNQDLLMLGLAMIGSDGSNVGQALSGAFGAISKNQQIQQQAQQAQQKLLLDQYRAGIYERQIAAQEAAQQLQQRKYQQDADKYNRQLDAQQQINALIGEEPNMINGFQGTGYQGGGMSQQELAVRMAPLLAQAGDNAGLLGVSKGSYGQPITMLDEQGQPVAVQLDNYGNAQPLEGYTPLLRKGMQITTSPGGGLSISEGGYEMPGGGQRQSTATAQTNRLQDDVTNALQTLNALDAIANNYSAQALTYPGQLRGAVGVQLGKLTGKSGDKEYIEKQTAFKNSVNQFFNQYRKLITGAAASEKELAGLKESILNTDQSPEQFESAYKQFRALTVKSMEISQQLLREGIPIGSPQYGEEMDRRLGLGGGGVQTGNVPTATAAPSASATQRPANDPLGIR